MTENVAEARRLLRKEAGKLQKALESNSSRTRGPLVRRFHEVRQMLSPLYAYTSQAGQDFVIDQIMKNKREGTFLDVGGFDGVTGSNTFFLETNRGWTGALVEPVNAQLVKAAVFRTCPCIGVAIAPTEGEADFIEISEGFTQMSGLAGTYDDNLLKRVRSDKRHRETVVKVKTKTLSSIIEYAGIPDPDFISLDIEGGEIACLKTFPFKDHDVKAWAIENNTGTTEIRDIMTKNGYDLIEFCGPDELYFKQPN
jgi:FkbM family methyltransferase